MSPYRPVRHQPTRRPRPAARSGFSLIELLAVVAIIAVLVAMLLPAIGAVRARANLARVGVDIKALETGIATFKTEFGSEPPSSIVLCEAPADWASVSATARSRVRKLWPQFDFTIARDINGDGDGASPDDVLTLSGAECLVFFLGGVNATANSSGAVIVDAAGNLGTAGTPVQWTPLGFSKNPRDPFERSGGTRVGPMTELDPARFVDLFPLAASANGMPELLDPLPPQSKPYLYASSYEGKGYDYADLGGARGSTAEWGDVYYQKLGAGALPALPAPQIPAGSVPWNKNGYQIISPGTDAEYGLGGLFEVDENYIIPTPRAAERDNITNFSSGPLND